LAFLGTDFRTNTRSMAQGSQSFRHSGGLLTLSIYLLLPCWLQRWPWLERGFRRQIDMASGPLSLVDRTSAVAISGRLRCSMAAVDRL
jgi:hypothetical protein